LLKYQLIDNIYQLIFINLIDINIGSGALWWNLPGIAGCGRGNPDKHPCNPGSGTA
jgi:hypothetical protein